MFIVCNLCSWKYIPYLEISVYLFLFSYNVFLMAGLKAAFDEKTLFPRYILDFEAKMKVFHQQTLRDTTVC